MNTYTSWVRTPSGASVQVFVQANTAQQAKQLLEIQHGARNFIHLPTPAN
jgi:hypothetical protein